MYCRKCRYSLCALETRACPECGCEYDPDDPNTYDTQPTTRLQQGLRLFALAMGAGWLIISAAVYVACCLLSGNWRLSMSDAVITLLLSATISGVSSVCIAIGALRLKSRVERIAAIVVIQGAVALSVSGFLYLLYFAGADV